MNRGTFPGAIKTEHGKRYCCRAAVAAGEDPVVAPYLQMLGRLFPSGPISGAEADAILNRFFAGQHPTTGQRLRARLNSGTRLDRSGKRVPNSLHAQDVELNVPKELSIAALVFKDELVLATCYKQLQRAAQKLCGMVGNKVGSGSDRHPTPNKIGGAGVFVPEKASRDRDPHIHAHTFMANIARVGEDRDASYQAGDFLALGRSLKKARWELNFRIFADLEKAGRAVSFDAVSGRCVLHGVPREAVDHFSKASASLSDRNAGASLAKRESSEAARRDKARIMNRPPKVFKTTEQWQSEWRSVPEVTKWETHYLSHRDAVLPAPTRTAAPDNDEPGIAPQAAEQASESTTAVGRSVASPEDELMADIFQLETITRKSLGEEYCSDVGATWEVECDYPGYATNMVKRQQVVRYAMMLLFRRVALRVKFPKVKAPQFRVSVDNSKVNPSQRALHMVEAYASQVDSWAEAMAPEVSPEQIQEKVYARIQRSRDYLSPEHPKGQQGLAAEIAFEKGQRETGTLKEDLSVVVPSKTVGESAETPLGESEPEAAKPKSASSQEPEFGSTPSSSGAHTLAVSEAHPPDHLTAISADVVAHEAESMTARDSVSPVLPAPSRPASDDAERKRAALTEIEIDFP